MAGKKGSKAMATKASKALRSKGSSRTTKSLAGHVLAHQAKGGKKGR